MSRDVVIGSLSVLAFAGLTGTAAAHHRPHFERCQLLTIGGQVERIEWGNPHVALSITADDGTRYDFVWLSPRRLGLDAVERETLKIGDHVVVMGTMQRDSAPVMMLLSDIRRPADGWQWSQLPQGC
jgi:hypothetical protein